MNPRSRHPLRIAFGLFIGFVLAASARAIHAVFLGLGFSTTLAAVVAAAYFIAVLAAALIAMEISRRNNAR